RGPGPEHQQLQLYLILRLQGLTSDLTPPSLAPHKGVTHWSSKLTHTHTHSLTPTLTHTHTHSHTHSSLFSYTSREKLRVATAVLPDNAALCLSFSGVFWCSSSASPLRSSPAG